LTARGPLPRALALGAIVDSRAPQVSGKARPPRRRFADDQYEESMQHADFETAVYALLR